MFRPIASSVRQPSPRRGALLIAVLGLLTLFAIFALFFVFYADSEATSSRIHREAQSPGSDGDFPVEFGAMSFNQTMSLIIFDDTDFATGVQNPLRGHSLARSMYGGLQGNSAPFSGIGTFHENAPNGQDRATWINFAAPYTPVAPYIHSAGPNTAFLDPEYSGFRTGQQVAANQLPGSLSHAFIPKNAPYTYPDLKDLILASVSPATGEVLVPSLHRNWLFNAGNPNPNLRLAPWNPDDPNLAANTDWVTPEGRTRILRPRPIDQMRPSEYPGGLYPVPPGMGGWTAAQKTQLYVAINSLIASGQIIGYPKPNADGSFSGDVQNLSGGVGVQKNDSILVDIGLPPRLWNSRWIKPLASILLTDLDGLLNLNAHGNLRGPGTPGSHGSHAGFGPNEVNLGMVLSTDAANIVQARYGIPAWSPNTNYTPGSIVMNYGNFYRNISGGPAMSGPAPGPTGTYPAPAAPNDGGVTWQDVSIGIPRNGNSTLQFDRSGTRVPTYAPVNFDGGGSNPTITYPGFPGNGFQTNTTYTNGGQTFFDDNVGDAASYNKYLNHPLLWNPNDWPSGVASRRAYPLADTKRFNLRYAADRNWYNETEVARAGTANTDLIGTFAANGSYRLDPAHTRRGLVTTLSTSLDLPHLPANFESSNAGVLILPPPPGPGQPQPLHPTNASFTGTFPTTISGSQDFAGPTNLRNQRAAFGPVDLNRPLADYRTDTSVALGQPSTTTPADVLNSGNYAQAWADRHNLARDIFARLIVSTGADATVDASGNVTVNPSAAPGSANYNALRYLAQLAANAVDLVDSDDVSTVFAWDLGAPLTQVDSTSVSLAATAAAGRTPTGLVYGVEKPRLVINEAYGEITNDPNEVLPNNAPANNNFRVRFWVELMNPTSSPPPPPGPPSGPLGNGGVAVHNGTFNPYQLVVTQVNAANNTALYSDPTNVAGTVTVPANGGFTFDFSPAAGNAALRTVLPVNGAYAPANGSPGFVMVGAADFTNQHSSGGSTVEFRPNAVPPFNTRMITGNVNVGAMVTNAMEYDFGSKPGAAALENAGNMNPYRRHAVLLRRLANPYLAFNAQTNPYVTVDLMDRVPAFDAVTRGGAAGDMNDRLPKAAAGITNAGFEPVDDTSGGTRRFSVGKVQPYAGAATASAVNNDVDLINNFPQSMVVRQSPAAANGSYPGNGNPLHTFFRQNGRNDAAPMAQTYNAAGLIGGETLMAPFDPYVHYDRLLVNQLELLSLQATKPHEVTQYTLRNNGGALVRNQGLAPWLGINSASVPPNQPGYDVTNNRTNNGLYRAFESLRVKPWTYGMASGGKVHGKININTIQDPRVLRALLDARNGNYFTSTEVDSLWTSMISSTAPTAGIPYRTWQTYNTATAGGTAMSVPLPGPTYDDVANPTAGPNFGTNPPYDRPFRSFGAPEFVASGTSAAYRNGGGVQDTLLRTWPVGTPLPGQPLAWSTNPNVMIPPPSPNPVSYPDTGLQSEMLRKMMNNTTTVSHAFAVTVTIVFHEVRLNGATPDTSVNEGPGPRYLIGREAFKDAPGDLRQQFYSIVDRSNLVLDPNPSVAVPLASGIHMQPVSASLDQAIVIGSMAPMPPAMSGFQTPPTGSYNVYLTNRVPAAGQPFTLAGNFGGQVTVYADGKPYVISAGRVISIGVGTGRESQLIVNYVNQDGSLNIGDPSNQLGFGVRTAPSLPHAAGELVSNFVTGNPGPVNPGNPSNPGPFEVLHPPANSPYTAVVPFAQRVR